MMAKTKEELMEETAERLLAETDAMLEEHREAIKRTDQVLREVGERFEKIQHDIAVDERETVEKMTEAAQEYIQESEIK